MNDIICLGGHLSNCYLLISSLTKETIIIDTGIDPNELIYNIKKNKLRPIYIINTHSHIDHIFANYEVSQKLNIEVFIHQDDYNTLNNPEFNLAYLFGIDTKPTNAKIIHDNTKIKIKGLELKVIHTPGHTPGSICLLEEGSKSLFSGDTLFKNGIGRTDLYGGNYDLLLESISNKLLTLKDDYKIYPGHGEPTSLYYERQNNPFILKRNF